MTEVFSSGGGTQSAAIAALIIQERLPRPDFAAIVDTEREHPAVWEYHDAVMKVEHCRGCNAEIVWLKTAKGKAMPVDASTVKEGDAQYEHGRHISHFATCKNAKQFKR